MKKLLKLIILVFALNILSVKAADFQTKITGDTKITSGGTITVTFKANSSVGLQGIQAKLNYDSSLLEIVSSKGASDFNLTLGSKAVLDSSTAKSGNFNFMVIKFKAKSAFNIGASTTISLSNVTGSDGTKTLTGTASSLTVKMASSENNLSDLTIDSKTINNFKSSTTSYKLIVENNVSKITIGAKAVDSKAKITGTGTKNLAIYNNTFKVVVTAESGATKTYTILVVRKDAQGYAGARSSDNKLKSLKIEDYDLEFDPLKKEYELEVKNEVSSLKIEAIANDSNAKVDISNTNLAVGLNKITIKVTAEDESVNEYIINVTRNNDNPVTTIDKFEEVSSNTTKDTIEVLVNDEVITKEDLEKIKKSGKNVIFAHYEDNKLIYAWHLLNEDIKTDKDFSTKVSFTSEYADQIGEATNYAEAFYVSSQNENDSKVKLKVLTNLTGKTKLYYYDQTIHLQSDDIEVNDSYVEFPFSNNNYFLSRMEIKSSKTNVVLIVLIVENILLAIGCISLIIVKKVKGSEVNEKV